MNNLNFSKDFYILFILFYTKQRVFGQKCIPKVSLRKCRNDEKATGFRSTMQCYLRLATMSSGNNNVFQNLRFGCDCKWFFSVENIIVNINI